MCSREIQIPILEDIFGRSEETLHKLMHYTTADGKKKIVSDQNVSLLLRRADCFLDENEGLLIIEPFYYACGELYEQGIIDLEFYELLKSISKDDIRKATSKTYIICFSKNGNSDYLKKRYSPVDGWVIYMLYDDLFDLSRIISEKRSRSRLLDVCYSFEDVSSICAKNIKSIFESYKNKLMNVNEEKRRLEKNVKKCIVEWLQENCFAYKASTYAYEEEVRLVYKPKRNFFVWENKKHGIKLESFQFNKIPYIKMVLDKKYLWYETQELDRCFDTKLNKAVISGKEIQEVFKNR